MSDVTKHKEFALETKTHAADGAGIGGAVGGTVGAVLATLMAIGTIVTVPGLGALVVAGPMIAALAGAGAGATTGGIIGALVGAGIPEHRAKVYDAGLREGRHSPRRRQRFASPVPRFPGNVRFDRRPAIG